MPSYRAYIDKQVVQLHETCDDPTCGHQEGGEHSRMIDGEAADASSFGESLKLKKGEVVGQIVELYEEGVS